MSRPLAFRFIALLLAVAAGFAAPASALMHGWLHEHAGHERYGRVDQQRLAAPSDRQAAHGDSTHGDFAHGVEIEQQDEHHRHGHDTVGIGVAVGDRQRLAVDLRVAVVIARAELTIPDDLTAPSVTIFDWESLPRPVPGGPSTPQPRAPPTC